MFGFSPIFIYEKKNVYLFCIMLSHYTNGLVSPWRLKVNGIHRNNMTLLFFNLKHWQINQKVESFGNMIENSKLGLTGYGHEG